MHFKWFVVVLCVQPAEKIFWTTGLIKLVKIVILILHLKGKVNYQYLRYISFQENRFAKCDKCSRFKDDIQKEANKDRRKALQLDRDAHIIAQK